MARQLRVEYPGAIYHVMSRGGRRLEEALEERRAGETDEEYKGIRRGWCFGAESFREELLGQMEERMGRNITARSGRRRRR